MTLLESKNTLLVNLLESSRSPNQPFALLIINKTQGREIAKNLKIPVVGTLGILLKAKRQGSILSMVDEMKLLRSKAGFFYRTEVAEAVSGGGFRTRGLRPKDH